MDELLNVLVNIFTITAIFTLYIGYKCPKRKKICQKVLSWVGCLMIGASMGCMAMGYGNLFISIVTLIAMDIFCVYEVYWSLCVKSRFCIIYYSGLVIFYLCLICKRLEYENIMKIKIIDTLEEVDIFRIFSSITQNEWFKGILIAALGGIISGLVLNEISKKK